MAWDRPLTVAFTHHPSIHMRSLSNDALEIKRPPHCPLRRLYFGSLLTLALVWFYWSYAGIVPFAEGPRGVSAPVVSNDGEGNLNFLPEAVNASAQAERPQDAVPLVRIAFFIQATKSTLNLLPGLLDALYDTESTFALHFDLKIDDESYRQAVVDLQERFGRDNVLLLEREPVTYRGITAMLNTVSALDALLECGRPWDFVVNLSGADFPLLSPRRMRELLALGKLSNNYLWTEELVTPDDQLRVRRMYVDSAVAVPHNGKVGAERPRGLEANKMYIANPVFADQPELLPKLRRGSAWAVLSRAFARYAVHSPQSRRLAVLLANSLSSSEIYLQTLIERSPFAGTVVPDALRYNVWVVNDQRAEQHPLYLDEHMGDILPILQGPVVALFARKIRQPHGPLVAKLRAIVAEDGDGDGSRFRDIRDTFLRKLERLGLHRDADGVQEPIAAVPFYPLDHVRPDDQKIPYCSGLNGTVDRLVSYPALQNLEPPIVNGTFQFPSNT